MISPRKGDEINVLPYGKATVIKMVDQGRCLVTIDRVIKRKDGGLSNQVIVELHPVWIVSEVVGEGDLSK